MSAPFFPPPQKKDSAPYRAAAAAPVAPPPVVASWPELREEPRAARVPEPEAEPSFLATFAWRFGVRVLSLGIVLGLVYGLVLASESGAKWPQLVIVVLGALGILASPFILFWRLKRIWQFLFARHDDR